MLNIFYFFKVNFMITNGLSYRRRRQSDNQQQQQQQQQQQYRMVTSDLQLYKELAIASGGQAIEVPKFFLLTATSIIKESTSSSLVLTKCSL